MPNKLIQTCALKKAQTNNDWHIALPGCIPYMISRQPPGRQEERNETEDFTLVD